MNVRNGIENLNQIFPSQATATPNTARSNNTPQSEGLRDDTARLSAVATQATQSGPVSEVRLDKVASIQSALEAGTYHVSAADVAKKVMHSMLATEE